MTRLRLLPLLFLGLLLYGCDSTTPSHRVSDDALVSNARTWFDTETSSIVGGNDVRLGGDRGALRRFYPAWEDGVTIEAPGGGAVVVTTVWRDANVTYDASLFFLRVLAVELSEKGKVEAGHLVEFVSPDSIAYADGPALVQAWLAEDFGQRQMLVIEHSVEYELERARQFMPGRAPVPKDIRVEKWRDQRMSRIRLVLGTTGLLPDLVTQDGPPAWRHRR